MVHCATSIILPNHRNLLMTEKNNTDRTKSPPVRPGHPGGHRGTEGGTSALILAAGLGTRFKPWTDKHPKALALVNGKTLLQRNVEYLQHYDIYNVVVNVHHFADQVKDIVDENNGWGSTIIISDESNELLETGGGMLKAKKLLDKSPFITLNVDVLTNLNLNILIEQHQKKMH